MSHVATQPDAATVALDVAAIRRDFPALNRQVHGRPLIYLDSAATALTPQPVIDAMAHYYSHCNANVHRAVHAMGEEATALFETARDTARGFINAGKREEIIVTRGSTEAINLVAQSYARPRLGPGDEILITHMEHHSNIVPWQMVCEQTGAKLKVAPVSARGEIDLDAFANCLNERTRLVSVIHVSNTLGTINPIADLIGRAHAREVPVLVDGSQALPHLAVDVQALDCDFYVGTGHKLYGPTGAGILYGKEKLLDEMPPYHGGGDMILSVRFDNTTYKGLPYKFEAGTPNIAGVIGLGAALAYVERIGFDRISAYEQTLLAHGKHVLEQVPGLRMIGTAEHKAALFSFVLEGIHPHDLGTILDSDGIAIRTGHHCTMPLMEFFGIPATARASLGFYNTVDEIDQLGDALIRARRILN